MLILLQIPPQRTDPTVYSIITTIQLLIESCPQLSQVMQGESHIWSADTTQKVQGEKQRCEGGWGRRDRQTDSEKWGRWNQNVINKRDSDGSGKNLLQRGWRK